MSGPGTGNAPPRVRLHRLLGTWGAVWMGLGSILGTGVFVSLGIAAGVVGPWVVLAVAVAALVATANGLSSAQLAAAHPVSGGTYEYGYRYLHPSVGFSAGWMFLCAKSASAATAALGFAGYLLHTLHIDGTGARIGVALALVVTLTLLVATGLRRSNVVNAVMVSVTLLGLATFVGAGAAGIDGDTAARHFDSTSMGSVGAFDFLQAVALLFVAYTGYGRIATLGEEVREPRRTIPRAIIATLVVSMVLYVAVSATAVAIVGADAFARATAEAAAPLDTVARALSTPVVAPIVAAAAVTAMAGVLLNLILGLSRVLLAMARRKDMPGSLAAVDERTGSPRRAVLAVGGLVAALVLIGDVKTTWSFSAFTVLVYYGITNLAALRLPAADRRFPRWIAATGLLACFGLAFFVELHVWPIGLGILAVGLLWHRLRAGTRDS